MPTPGELNKIKSAVAKAAADLLARDDNAEKSAEEIAEEISEAVTETVVTAYEAIQAKSYNLVVVASFKLPDGTVHTAAVGPVSTRATKRARDVGERFAWDYKTRRGEGTFTLMPLIRDPREAWDEARQAMAVEYVHDLTSITPGEELTYEPMRFELDDATRARIAEAWEARPGVLERQYGPACICGMDTTLLREQGKYAQCPRHPEESDGRQDPAGSD